MQPFRFLHAANLLLDHPLQQVDHLDPRIAAIAEQATLRAFRQIVETAVAEEVDFLLLAGNCLDSTDYSLQAEIALLRGLEELADYGIDVYIAPGETDPVATWDSLPQLPENTTVLTRGERVTIVRDDAPVASLQLTDEPAVVTGDGPYPIVVSRNERLFPAMGDQFANETSDGPAIEYELISDNFAESPSTPPQHDFARRGVRYWAVGSGDARRTVYIHDAVAHHPGGTQALSPTQGGAHGCTLVEVDEQGRTELTFVPAAAVRFETLTLNLHGGIGHGQLLEQIETAVDALHRHPSDAALLLSWQIRGDGPARQLLADPEFHRETDDRLQAMIHDAEMHVASLGPQNGSTARTHSPSFPPGSLAAEYWKEMTASKSDETDEATGAVTAEPKLLRGPWEDELKQLRKTIDDRDLLDHAARWAQEWFGDLTEESA